MIGRRMLIGAMALVGAMLALSAYAWVSLPAGAQIAAHWDAQGTPDSYIGKEAGLLIVPAVASLLALLLGLLPLIEARRDNLARSSGAYRAVCLASIAVLLIVHATLVAAALGHQVDVTKAFVIAAALMLAVMGNYLGKVRANGTFGIRTPWTMSSELSWDKTHRATGRLVVVLGLLTAGAAVFAPTPVALAALMGFAVAMLVFGFAYSYVVWRGDPDR
jgi:uncharacterized membrane protein